MTRGRVRFKAVPAAGILALLIFVFATTEVRFIKIDVPASADWCSIFEVRAFGAIAN